MKSMIPKIESSVLVLIDVQQRLIPAMSEFDAAGNRISLLLAGAGALGMKVIVTEQYPKGLGSTQECFAELLPPGTPVIAKTGFSVFEDPEFCRVLEDIKPESLIFCGIESHVCVFQSVLDSLEQKYNTILAADAVTSRKVSDRELAIAQMRAAGAMTVSSESILFMLMRNAGHSAFKEISKLVR